METSGKNRADDVGLFIEANDPKTLAEELDRLAGLDLPYVRALVAKNKSASEKTLLKLAQDSDSVIRWLVVNNPSVTDWVLELLSKDNSENVRNAAQNALKKKSNIST